jgi:hypothetical protein
MTNLTLHSYGYLIKFNNNLIFQSLSVIYQNDCNHFKALACKMV